PRLLPSFPTRRSSDLQIPGNATHSHYILALANRALVVNDPFVTASLTSINRMIDGTVSNAFVMHYFYNLGYGFYIFLSFSVQFYVSDMSSAGNGVERSFPFYLLGDGDGLFYI